MVICQALTALKIFFNFTFILLRNENLFYNYFIQGIGLHTRSEVDYYTYRFKTINA
jgi:hypothetical protein